MKKQLLFWTGIISAFLFTRLFNLLIIPIFTDEAIYTNWAQIALHDPANRFISLEDGKQPLFIWLAAILQKFFEDPLVATRLVSTLSGLGSTVGIFLISKFLFNTKIAQISSILYIFLPFTLLYDRMAVFDSLLTMLGIYSVLFTIKLIKDPRLDIAMLAGVLIGLATITKSSGYFFLYLFPFSILLFDFGKEETIKKISKWLIMASIVFIISQLIYNSLRLSPLFYIIGQKNLTFIRSFSEVFKNPSLFFYSNLNSLLVWTKDYMSLPLFTIFIFSALTGLIKKNLKIIYLLSLILAPFVTELLFNKVLYPRFILFYFPYVIILAAYGINQITEIVGVRKYSHAVLVLLMIIPAITSWKLLTVPTKAGIPSADSGQYLNDWPAGYGVREVVEFLKKESNNREVYVGTEGTFGLLPFALQIYFYGNNNIQIIGFWPVDDNNLPVQVLEAARKKPTFFVFNENQKVIINAHLKLISKYQKGTGNSFMRLYEVLP